MEEVVGSIPTRSTKINNLRQVNKKRDVLSAYRGIVDGSLHVHPHTTRRLAMSIYGCEQYRLANPYRMRVSSPNAIAHNFRIRRLEEVIVHLESILTKDSIETRFGPASDRRRAKASGRAKLADPHHVFRAASVPLRTALC